MISVDEAQRRVLADVLPRRRESVPIVEAAHRVLAEPVVATRPQPPFAASAMDGYAVRAADLSGVVTRLSVIGESAAGHGYQGQLGRDEAVRIFTGAPLPTGADAILIQENATRDGDTLETSSDLTPGTYVRPAGLDFDAGDQLLDAGRRLDSRALSVAAAAGYATLSVISKPQVAILATGDELVAPGEEPGPDQIYASNQIGIACEVEAAGGAAISLGIAKDDRQEIADQISKAVHEGADIVVTLGGASVGEHDFVGRSLDDVGMQLDFWKIAMRPGKPLMFGRVGNTHILGLPGNPVSGLVCTKLFLLPLIRKMLGLTTTTPSTKQAVLEEDLGTNDRRQDYVRAIASKDADGTFKIRAFKKQDSSMLNVFARANALIIRAPHAPAAQAGDLCPFLALDPDLD